MKIKPMIYRIASFFPGIEKFWPRRIGASASARYCYSVWLRHLVMAQKNGLNPHPGTVVELGPGDSIGVGLAALISGSDQYYGLDIAESANVERNLRIFDELVTLFINGANIPSDDELPGCRPYLYSYKFPSEILDDHSLTNSLQPMRLRKIREFIRSTGDHDSPISYKIGWSGSSIPKESVDMIISQAALEHMDDLPHLYTNMYQWLKPGGYMSHQIDFTCHSTAPEWNGHWRYSDEDWKRIQQLVRPLNREPHSVHIDLLKENHFVIVCDFQRTFRSFLSRDDLAERFET